MGKASKNSTFICSCDEGMRQACLGESYYREYNGKQYCVLHYPSEKKSGDFKISLKRKLENQAFKFTGVWFPSDVSFYEFQFTREAEFIRAVFNGTADFLGVDFQFFANFSSATFNGDVEFAHASFQAGAYFGQVVFKGLASFPLVMQPHAFYAGQLTCRGE